MKTEGHDEGTQTSLEGHSLIFRWLENLGKWANGIIAFNGVGLYN